VPSESAICHLLAAQHPPAAAPAASTPLLPLHPTPPNLTQGDTKLALYGLGNIRDERLGRLFQTAGAVTWWVPRST